MKYLKFILAGIVFGIVLSKGQVISWYRILEMFYFDSFHMYGIIGSAVVLGAVMILWMKRSGFKDISGQPVHIIPKKMSVSRYLIGGIVFGLGWAMVGACPGPMYILLGRGYWLLLIVIAGAVAGTFFYGLLRNKLPH